MSENLIVKGNLKHVGNPIEYGQEKKTLRKFYIDIDKDGQYPTVAEFTVFGDKIDFNAFAIGDTIEVRFSLSGKSWKNEQTGKSGFFTSLNAFAVNKIYQEAAAPPNAETPTPEVDDDLPF